jgi:hypothetical protein
VKTPAVERAVIRQPHFRAAAVVVAHVTDRRGAGVAEQRNVVRHQPVADRRSARAAGASMTAMARRRRSARLATDMVVVDKIWRGQALA